MSATNHDSHSNDGHKPWRPQNMTMYFVAGVWILLVLDCLCTRMTSLDDAEEMESILKSFLFTKKISINTYVAQLM